MDPFQFPLLTLLWPIVIDPVWEQFGKLFGAGTVHKELDASCGLLLIIVDQ